MLNPEIEQPLSIESVREPMSTLHLYSARIHDIRSITHPQNVMYILHDFVGNDIPLHAYHAALLHDVADRAVDDIYQQNARTSLHDYYNNIPEEHREYVFALLGDMKQVEEYAEDYRNSFKHRDQTLVSLIQSVSNKDQEVAKRYWLAESTMTKPAKMLEALEDVNIESVLIKAAELLENLNTPSSKDVAVLQDIFEAESFYAPLLEILGYDGFAMAIRSRALITRLEKSGNAEYVEEASAVIESVADSTEITTMLTELMTQVSEGFAMSAVVSNRSGNHNTNIGELVKDFAHDGESMLLRGVWRVKSLGSLAMKLFQGRGEMPADIVGLTVIPENIAAVSDYFAHLVSVLPNIDGVELTASRSRTEAVHIKGGGDFIERVRSALPRGIPIDVVGSSNHKEFQVAKVTFNYKGVPMEIQVMTEADRLNSRTGIASHAAYKAGDGDFDPEVLVRIKDRRNKLAERSVNPRTLQRAESMTSICLASSVK